MYIYIYSSPFVIVGWLLSGLWSPPLDDGYPVFFCSGHLDDWGNWWTGKLDRSDV